DVSPWENFTTNYFASLRQVSEGIHNTVHRWVAGIVGTNPNDENDPGGTMLKMTSPNDPVFWLHHAAIDRLWSIWQEVRTAPDFLGPSTGTTPAPIGHRAGASMIFGHGTALPWAGTTNPETVADEIGRASGSAG